MAVLIGIALTVSAQAQTRMPEPVTDNLPGLPGQTGEWWAEYRKAQAEENARKKQAQTADGESNFYTGKPYDAEIGGYVFKYRNYSPETQRWTTADPSGFPDGANNYGYVNAPTIQLDWQGLLQLSTASKQTNDLWRGTPIPGGPLATYEIWSCLTDDGNYAITLLKYISGGFIGANYDSTYNCYGYAFASGQYWIQGDQVENILKGDGYQEVKVDDTDNMINTRVAMSYGDDHSGVPVISDSGVVEQILYKNGGYSGIKGAAPSAVFPNRTPVYYE